ncbi:MAG: Mur ligase domain-containing protein [Desulfobacterales bacterium]|nr:Mur ligase domain-containing protein [Desulfobacterales bacterium]
MPWTLEDILKATHGDRVAGDRDRSFDSISIDSRRITAADVFVAIRGAVHDGHRFLREVVDAGVRGLVVDRRRVGDLPAELLRAGQLACVAVADTTRALGDLAAYHRRRSPAAVIAVTGSNGKTSTRRMTAAVLSTALRGAGAGEEPEQPDRRPAHAVSASSRGTRGRSSSSAPTCRERSRGWPRSAPRTWGSSPTSARPTWKGSAPWRGCCAKKARC